MYRKIFEKNLREKIREAESLLYSKSVHPKDELEVDLLFADESEKIVEDGYYAMRYNSEYGFAEPLTDEDGGAVLLLSFQDAIYNDVDVAASCGACHVAYCI